MSSSENESNSESSEIDIDAVKLKSGQQALSAFEINMTKIKEKLNVTFSDLNLSVKIGKPWKKTNKPILQGVSGYCESGQMLAIMGASGAGKTTLLNVLSGRAVGQISGKISINGHVVGPKQIKAISSFVMQDDLLLHYLTVRETIAFSAKLKVRGLTTNEKMQRVDRLVDELQLKKKLETQSLEIH